MSDIRREAEALVNNCTVPASPEEEQEVIDARWNEQLISDIEAFAKAQRREEVEAVRQQVLQRGRVYFSDPPRIDPAMSDLADWLSQRKKELE